MADFKCYLFNRQDHIVKRCDLMGETLELVLADARTALRGEAGAAKFEIWRGARLLYSESAHAAQRAPYSQAS